MNSQSVNENENGKEKEKEKENSETNAKVGELKEVKERNEGNEGKEQNELKEDRKDETTSKSSIEIARNKIKDNLTDLTKIGKDKDKEKEKKLNDYWKYTLICDTECQLLRWKRDDINQYLSSNSRLRESAINAMNADLHIKLTRGRHTQSLVTYREMIATAALNDRISRAEREKLNNYRIRHELSEEEHNGALEAIGWTTQEFERGYKYLPVVNHVVRWWRSLDNSKSQSNSQSNE